MHDQILNEQQDQTTNEQQDQTTNSLLIKLYEDMFAVRIYLEDEFNSEINIIKELKKYLVNRGIRISQLNQIIFDFYNYYGINISLEVIEDIRISLFYIYSSYRSSLLNNDTNDNNTNDNTNDDNTNNLDDINNNSNDINNNSDDINNTTNINDIDDLSNFISNQSNNIVNTYTNIDNSINSILNIFSTILNRINTDSQEELQDVIVTVEDNDLDKLNKYKLEEDLNIDCSICLSSMNKDDKIIELECCHKYHSNCIYKYLKEYNHKCPVCRIKIGNAKYNI